MDCHISPSNVKLPVIRSSDALLQCTRKGGESGLPLCPLLITEYGHAPTTWGGKKREKNIQKQLIQK